jgi:replicative DNA helicase
MDTYPWKPQKGAFQEALSYIHKRKNGTITSFKTPWSKVNEAGVDGLEWQSLLVVGGRPGTGKTTIKDQIVREAFKHNRGSDMRVLEFQFEMVARASKVREFSSVLGKPYKYICSASTEHNRLTDEDFEKLKEYSKKMVDIDKHPVDIVEKPCTITEFKKIVHKYMEQHAIIRDTERKDENNNFIKQKVYTNTLVTIDHSLLFKLDQGQSNKTAMLMDLGEAITELKRLFPIIFIVLSQLGRDTDSPERNENGKYGNYVLPSDIFGGDALFQHADMVIGVNKPYDKNITQYGPNRFIISEENILVFHFLKTRTGDTRMSFFKAEFDKMSVIETETPPCNKPTRK